MRPVLRDGWTAGSATILAEMPDGQGFWELVPAFRRGPVAVCVGHIPGGASWQVALPSIGGCLSSELMFSDLDDALDCGEAVAALPEAAAVGLRDPEVPRFIGNLAGDMEALRRALMPIVLRAAAARRLRAAAPAGAA